MVSELQPFEKGNIDLGHPVCTSDPIFETIVNKQMENVNKLSKIEKRTTAFFQNTIWLFTNIGLKMQSFYSAAIFNGNMKSFENIYCTVCL